MGWVAARRAELDVVEEQLAGQLAQVRAEREELTVAERVFARFGERGPARRRRLDLRLHGTVLDGLWFQGGGRFRCGSRF
jgi:hypothetical protein